jgi:hypothetical protein
LELGEGIPAFREYIYKALEINLPYDQFARDLLTADAMSTATNGAANFLARERVMEAEGFSTMNHEDTCDEQAISARPTVRFLSVCFGTDQKATSRPCCW